MSRRLGYDLRDLLRRATGTVDDEVAADGGFLRASAAPTAARA